MSKLYEDKHAQKHQLSHSDTKSNLPVNAWSKKNMNHKNDHFTQYKSKTWLKHEHDHIHDYL